MTTYPRTRIWNRDHSEPPLFDTDLHAGTAEAWYADSGHTEPLNITVDYGQSWRTRFGGRISYSPDGNIEIKEHREYLEHLIVTPNPLFPAE